MTHLNLHELRPVIASIAYDHPAVKPEPHAVKALKLFILDCQPWLQPALRDYGAHSDAALNDLREAALHLSRVRTQRADNHERFFTSFLAASFQAYEASPEAFRPLTVPDPVETWARKPAQWGILRFFFL
jgi:hypothetical protein